jgi:quinol monooxygenase YgiN
MVARISLGSFEPERADEVERRLAESELSLRPAIEKLTGNRGYLAGIDRKSGTMTNTSLWESLEAAEAMATLPEMLALRDTFEALGVRFQPITNHQVLWRL